MQPGIGIGIAVADSIGYRALARYQSNPCGHGWRKNDAMTLDGYADMMIMMMTAKRQGSALVHVCTEF